jgi:20S proteasome subunit beta 5
MDSLVSQYSRPAYTEEGPSEEEQLQLYSGAPELSLKFAIPPVAQVRSSFTVMYREWDVLIR